VFNACSNRYGPMWTKLQLRRSTLDPNHDIYVHGARGLLGWGITRRELKVPSEIAPIRKSPKRMLPPPSRRHLSRNTKAKLIGASYRYIYIYRDTISRNTTLLRSYYCLALEAQIFQAYPYRLGSWNPLATTLWAIPHPSRSPTFEHLLRSSSGSLRLTWCRYRDTISIYRTTGFGPRIQESAQNILFTT